MQRSAVAARNRCGRSATNADTHARGGGDSPCAELPTFRTYAAAHSRVQDRTGLKDRFVRGYGGLPVVIIFFFEPAGPRGAGPPFFRRRGGGATPARAGSCTWDRPRG